MGIVRFREVKNKHMISKQWRKAGSANSMQKTEWSFAKNVDPVSRIYKSKLQKEQKDLNIKQNQRPLEEWQREKNDYGGQQAHERMLTLLIIREIQTKTTMKTTSH